MHGSMRLEAPLCQEYDPATSQITAFLIDLDGTFYEPGGLIPGARRFYQWLRQNKVPFVFLSNTGAKSSIDVIKKLSSEVRTRYLRDTSEMPSGY